MSDMSIMSAGAAATGTRQEAGESADIELSIGGMDCPHCPPKGRGRASQSAGALRGPCQPGKWSLTWSADDVLTVPVGALFRTDSDWGVYAVKGGRARTTVVRIGHRNAQMAEVLSGLSAGDSVVLHPSDRVRAGAAVAQREIR